MSKNSIFLGKVSGIPIRAHLLLLIALPFVMTWFEAPNFFIRLIGAVGIFASVALHELGHSIVAQKKGSYIQEIVLYPFGGAAKIANIPETPKDEIHVALAGPAVSLILAVIGLFIGIVISINQPERTSAPLSMQLGFVNLGLVLFNMLPAFPMDGGRVLRASLSRKKGRMVATRMAATVGKYFCIAFVIIGLLSLHFILAFIGVYIFFAGQAEYRYVLKEHEASHYSGFQQNQMGVEVSPPPYATGGGKNRTMMDRMKDLFRD